MEVRCEHFCVGVFGAGVVGYGLSGEEDLVD